MRTVGNYLITKVLSDYADLHNLIASSACSVVACAVMYVKDTCNSQFHHSTHLSTKFGCVVDSLPFDDNIIFN